MDMQKCGSLLQVSVQGEVDRNGFKKIAFVLTVMRLNRLQQRTAAGPAALLFNH
ncbi:hypothetical protein D3C80_2223390 [compost metagenome]